MTNKFMIDKMEKAHEEPKNFIYTVKTENSKNLLNVRSTPEVKSFNIIGSLHFGDKVEASAKLDRSNEFTEIKFNGGVAFVMTSKLE